MLLRIVPVIALTYSSSRATEPANTVHFVVDPAKDVHPISPYIYGVNEFREQPHARPLSRLGGNRWTAYNWETNASNAGSDWHHQNDDFLSKSSEPGAAVRASVENAARHNQALILTVPIAGYVAADKAPEGDVYQSPNYLETRFDKSLPKKSGPLSLKPDLEDHVVYQDEFVNWVEKSARASPHQQIFYALDNEPDLWAATHQRIHPDKLTYAEIVKRTVDFASAIKDVKPDAIVFAPVNYGWNGFRTLQDAPDANGRDFHQFFLAEMKKAEQQAGRRIIDVLDVHWYPEAQADGKRITEKDTSPAVVAARVQAPRSLWDPTYVETSWITRDSTHGQPIALIPRLRKDVEQFYPGTKIAITEYNFGAGNHISGAIAQADVLGIFGREGIFAAAYWDLGQGHDYVDAALDLYLNYDGQGSRFGDQSVFATTDDNESTSIYAATDEHDASKLTVILINKTDHDLVGRIRLGNHTRLGKVERFQLTSEAPRITPAGQIAPGAEIQCPLPAYSVTLLRVTMEE
jgi:hypothetical protein